MLLLKLNINFKILLCKGKPSDSNFKWSCRAEGKTPAVTPQFGGTGQLILSGPRCEKTGKTGIAASDKS